MADNLAISQGVGTTVATDDIGGVHYQRVKPVIGADGTAVDVSAGAGAVGTGVQRVTLASDDPVTTSVQIMDDWDESDRAKVNLIVGQAGVAAGAGAVGATVQRVTLASDDPLVSGLVGTEYETVAASQTDQALGATGATGDLLRGLLIVPATTGAGNVSIKDGAGSSISVFATGTLADLTPIWIPLGIKSGAGAWSVTTGANVSVIATGNFT